MIIEQIRPQVTWWLRRDVLYPNEQPADMAMPEDETGMHFGGFHNGRLIAVVSLFMNGKDFQFRKFAVQHEAQGKDYGKQLLEFLVNFSTGEGAQRLWCNARESAIGFYSRFGFISKGETFERKGINYTVMEKKLMGFTY
ncbi:GNAT family N-acetyltransferase [Mucilaginibacter ginkgonis]|nr:GNAT family N-acetyltransferase [Mucilaginibacter ginkgonis]